jgi:acetoin utilization protein AcuB
MLVRELMTAHPMTIDPEAPVETAVEVMRERELRHLPVVDGQGHLVGIVTDRDLRGAILGPAVAEYLPAIRRGRLQALARSLDEVQVRYVMTGDVITIGPAAPVEQAAAIMLDARIGCLPVVEDRRLVGIVTERDVLRAVAATLPSLKGADPDEYFW